VNLEIPQHIAIIMDGNGRWAQRRGHPRVFGHVRGSARVKDIVKEASRLGVKALTLYAFSTENWSRPEGERRVLWKLLKKYLTRDAEELHRQNVRLRVIGEIDRLGGDVRLVLDRVIDKLSANTGLQLTFALSYGSRREIARATQLFAEDCVAGKSRPELMSEELMQNYLWTSGLGQLAEVDLFIRTSGECRVSNFLLWQSAYAEFVFVDRCWPDFESHDLRLAIEEYSRRDRRFGGLGKSRPGQSENRTLIESL
jgi:undecaprenyl diphosphate synthase